MAGLRRCRLGLLGYPFPGMGDFAVDTTHLVSTLLLPPGPPSGMEEYIGRAAAAADHEVERLKADYRQSYELAEDLTEADLDAVARAEWSLRSMVADHRLDALSYQFLAFGEDQRTVTLPFVAMSRLMADGIGFAGEGIWSERRAPGSFSRLPASLVQRDLHRSILRATLFRESHGRGKRGHGSAGSRWG